VFGDGDPDATDCSVITDGMAAFTRLEELHPMNNPAAVELAENSSGKIFAAFVRGGY
jgi:hypothetical protein